jgi:DNA-binding transcriptional MerR regulator
VKQLTIGKLATATQVGIDTLRYYEGRKLLTPAARSPSGYRLYSQDAVARVRFIKKAQGLGFSLRDIAALLRFGSSQMATAGDVLAMTRKKIEQHKKKIAELVQLNDVLEQLAHDCPGEGATAEACPILDHFKVEE